MLLILCGPSGVGKTTLAHRLLDEVPTFGFSVSYTTRAPRPGEQDGVDYHFVPLDTFDRMVDEGAFAEHARVHGNRYGTTRATIQEALDAGRSLVFDIDWQGAQQLRDAFPDAVTVMLAPPSWAALESRLRQRSTDDEATIRRRLDAARSELAHHAEFNAVLVNDDLDTTWQALRTLVLRGDAPPVDDALAAKIRALLDT